MSEFGQHWIEGSQISAKQFELIESKLKPTFSNIDIELTRKILIDLFEGDIIQAQHYCIKSSKPDQYNCLRKVLEHLVNINKVYSRMVNTRPR